MSETPRSTSQSRRHSRRSTGNINFAQMSVSPLTSMSLTEDDFKPSKEQQTRRSVSYIQGISAPTTPGILSRTPSFHRRAPLSPGLELPKSKSSSQLTRTRGSSEWLHRTGAALTSEARESKGQGWLSTRASSTSLVRLETDADEEVHMYGADDEFSPASPMWGMREEFDYMSARTGIGGSNVHREETEESEEEDMDLRGGYRLGQLIDRLIGWSVFAEDETDSEDDSFENKPVKPVRERIGLAPVEEEKLRDEQRQRRDQDAGWQDPAWIFSIASNVLF